MHNQKITHPKIHDNAEWFLNISLHVSPVPRLSIVYVHVSYTPASSTNMGVAEQVGIGSWHTIFVDISVPFAPLIGKQ